MSLKGRGDDGEAEAARFVLRGRRLLRDGDYGIVRHRWFEFWKPQLLLVPTCQHPPRIVSVFGHGGHIYHGVEQWRRVMGIDWMKRDEIAQAIPPAFTEFVGAHLMQHLDAMREAA